MTSEKQPALVKHGKEKERFDFGAAIAVGVSLGLVFGTALGNTAMGIATGLLLATLANAYHEREQGEKHANVAFAISVGALMFMILVWVLSALGWF